MHELERPAVETGLKQGSDKDLIVCRRPDFL